MIRRGEIWWATLADPRGSEPGCRRPIIVVQSDEFNASLMATVLVVPLSTTIRLAKAPGNVLLHSRDTALTRDSVALVSQVLTVDRRFLTERVRQLRASLVEAVDAGLRLALDLSE